MSLGVPVKVMHEAEGHIVTIETIDGEVYRGKLFHSEDNMNCLLHTVTMTSRDGRTTSIQEVFIRGSRIMFMILPDMLKNAPMFKRLNQSKAAARAGKAAVMKAQSNKI